MNVRPRTAADLEPCVDFLRAVHAADGYPLLWPDDPASWLSPRGLLSAWVAEFDARPAGHVALVRDPRSGAREPSGRAELCRLLVAPTLRRRGVASELIATVRREAGLRGWGLWLDVVEDRGGAVEFYERSGWRLVERRRAGWFGPAGRPPVVRTYVDVEQPGSPSPPS